MLRNHGHLFVIAIGVFSMPLVLLRADANEAKKDAPPTLEQKAHAPESKSLPTCKRAQLRAVISGGEGAGGHSVAWLVIFNTSPAACSVSGPATLELRDRYGKVISRSQGHMPFISQPAARANLYALDASVSLEAVDAGDIKRRVVTASIAQGECPGGVFPQGSRLFVKIRDIGAIEIEKFPGTLPFNYRCDEGQSPPIGKPELLIGGLEGRK